MSERDEENTGWEPNFGAEFFGGKPADPDDFESLDDLVEVFYDGVYESDSDSRVVQYVMLTDGQRRMPIMIGTPEAKAILDAYEGVIPDRPMTHDLLKTVVERMGGVIEKIIIDDLWNEKYYAKLFVLRDREEIIIDSRPSDAIALAVRFSSPIYVQSRIIDLVHAD